MSKIIGIDVYSALHSPRGMGIYVINFLKYLAEIDNKNQYILYGDIADKGNVLPKQSNFKFKELHARGLLHYEQFVLPKQCKLDKISILHSPANTSPVFLDKNIKRILTLHDVIFLKKEIPLPYNKKQFLGRLYYALTALLNTKRANIILAPTEYSKNDIAKTLKIKLNKILVDSRGHEHFDVHNATNLEELNNKYNIPASFCFCLGGEAPSKNVKLLLETIKKISDKNIVIAGIKNLETSKLYSEYKNYKNIIFVPYISQADIVGLYKNAEFFIFPSLYEGFGLPLLEAMKCRCPIISSNATCLPEVAGDAALYFNPRDNKDLLECIKQLHTNRAFLQLLKLKQKERIECYSWYNVAKVILQVYSNILKGEYIEKF